jgi:hypothetical protein
VRPTHDEALGTNAAAEELRAQAVGLIEAVELGRRRRHQQEGDETRVERLREEDGHRFVLMHAREGRVALKFTEAADDNHN